MDLPNGKLAPVTVSLIKQITGGDVITTERKFETMRDVRSNMRFLFASNYPITVSKEDGDSFWNRMIIIPFQYSVEKKDMDYNLLETLMKEKDDIISLCLQAFHIVLRRGCIFSECQIAEEMKKQWRKPEEDLVDTLKNFVKDCIHITGDEHDSIYAQDFYHLYKKYCQSYKRECMDYNKVIAWCSSNMPDCERKRIHHTGENPKSGYTGMKLADD
jgi:putative DNA primase/helicase